MKLFFKDIRAFVIVYFISLFITVMYILSFKDFSIDEAVYIIFFNSIILILFIIYKYIKSNKLYKFLLKDKKESKDFVQNIGTSPVLEEINQNFKRQYEISNIEIERNRNNYSEHLTFINQWVHQMKTPLSVLKLKNELLNDVCIEEQIEKMNKGLNLAMYYARIDSFTKDFVIEKANVKGLIKKVINSEKHMFIINDIYPKVTVNEDIEVLTDKKWIVFVLDQIIINAIKYSKNISKKIEISSIDNSSEIILKITDFGEIIPSKDIKRVFEPFFTGENGRKYGESTGMGLYLVKRICDELGHMVSIKSSVDEGTTVSIIFNE